MDEEAGGLVMIRNEGVHPDPGFEERSMDLQTLPPTGLEVTFQAVGIVFSFGLPLWPH